MVIQRRSYYNDRLWIIKKKIVLVHISQTYFASVPHLSSLLFHFPNLISKALHLLQHLLFPFHKQIMRLADERKLLMVHMPATRQPVVWRHKAKKEKSKITSQSITVLTPSLPPRTGRSSRFWSPRRAARSRPTMSWAANWTTASSG